MEKYSINEVSLIKNEKAIFPMMGEFHFSRCPEKEWEDEIRKMKACGMDIIATYVFWIHWTGNAARAGDLCLFKSF